MSPSAAATAAIKDEAALKKGAKADQGRKLMRATSTTTPAVENDKVGGLLKKDKGQERKSLRVTFHLDEGANSDPASSSKTKTSDIDEDMDESARLNKVFTLFFTFLPFFPVRV